jgi:large subunit ribosomal protein L30e
MSSKKVKKVTDSVSSKLQLVMRSGKYTLGWNTTLKAIRQGKI